MKKQYHPDRNQIRAYIHQKIVKNTLAKLKEQSDTKE